MSAPKLSESIPAVTRPVKLPRVTPGPARELAGVIAGGVLLLVAAGLLAFGLMVTS